MWIKFAYTDQIISLHNCISCLYLLIRTVQQSQWGLPIHVVGWYVGVQSQSSGRAVNVRYNHALPSWKFHSWNSCRWQHPRIMRAVDLFLTGRLDAHGLCRFQERPWRCERALPILIKTGSLCGPQKTSWKWLQLCLITQVQHFSVSSESMLN